MCQNSVISAIACFNVFLFTKRGKYKVYNPSLVPTVTYSASSYSLYLLLQRLTINHQTISMSSAYYSRSPRCSRRRRQLLPLHMAQACNTSAFNAIVQSQPNSKSPRPSVSTSSRTHIQQRAAQVSELRCRAHLCGAARPTTALLRAGPGARQHRSAGR